MAIDAGVLGEALGHHAGVGDYAVLAWMASSLATIAGGLGAGLESDEAVREAAYGYRVERASERDSRSIDSVVRGSSGDDSWRSFRVERKGWPVFRTHACARG